ncbi:TPA: AMP-binding protein [Bacillus cereus]|nr:AMP-binding protein [Bacillus cereus]
MVDKMKVFMGRPILVDGESQTYVYQPTMKEVVDMGEDYFQRLTMPFTLTTEAFFTGADNEEELVGKWSIFELFFLRMEEGTTILDKPVFNGEDALEVLKQSLSYFLRADDIQVLVQRSKIIVNKAYLIDKNEFENLRKIVQEALGRKDIEVEKPPKNMTQRQKDIWEKLQKGRRRKAEKDAIHIQDIANYVSFGGTSYISPKEIDEMTYYQFYNAYKSIVGMDSYRTGMQYKLSQKFDVKDTVKHWMETLKIGK